MEYANTMAALYQIALNPAPRLKEANWTPDFYDFVDFVLKKNVSFFDVTNYISLSSRVAVLRFSISVLFVIHLRHFALLYVQACMWICHDTPTSS